MAAPKKGQKRKKAAAAAASASGSARVGLRSSKEGGGGNNAQRHASRTGESDEGEAWTQLWEAWRKRGRPEQGQGQGQKLMTTNPLFSAHPRASPSLPSPVCVYGAPVPLPAPTLCTQKHHTRKRPSTTTPTTPLTRYDDDNTVTTAVAMATVYPTPSTSASVVAAPAPRPSIPLISGGRGLGGQQQPPPRPIDAATAASAWHPQYSDVQPHAAAPSHRPQPPPPAPQPSSLLPAAALYHLPPGYIAYLEEQHYAALQHHQQLQYGNAAAQNGQSLPHTHFPVASTSAGPSNLQSHAHGFAHGQYDQTQHAYYQNYSEAQQGGSAPAGPPNHAAGTGSDSAAGRTAEQEAAAAELAQQYATVSQIEATPYTDPETGDAVYPCPFCDKSYAGKHGRSIWRRHLSNKHGIPLHIQPRRTRWDNGGCRSGLLSAFNRD